MSLFLAASVLMAPAAMADEPEVDDSEWASDDATYDVSGTLYKTARFIFANKMWAAGYTGDGIDIALIDSGVVPVAGLTAPGKVINGPDLSFESQAPNMQYLDTFGHGTHLAGIMVGLDPDVEVGNGEDLYEDAGDHFVGIAPEARLVSLKVADANGAVDVTQVIAAIDWVVQHRNDNGMNIRVINLSFGTDSLQDYQIDPLSFAVENAWK
ncbi:MAG: S8 family serine peptidase, partial [Acidimicrobiia bacterium]|nr:S8 family serine peptidase [Acidimicrobiia bacterium]